MLMEVFDGRHSRAHNDGAHRIQMEPYAWRWFRVGAADNTLNRSDLNVIGDDIVR
jgi:maltose alpha-D-glucosyltransferase/alpha-amylase